MTKTETARLEAMERDRLECRAWDLEKKVMIDDFLNYAGWQAYNGLNNSWRDGRYKKLQCTGIKDKNNTLIYEGDKVRYYAATKIIIFYKGSLVAAQEDYKPGEKIDYMGLQTLYDSYWEVEVLGNIYDNKNFLACEVEK